MKKIDYKFMGMGLVFLFFGLLLHRFLIFIAGLAFIIYSFFSRGMAPTKENIFKPKLRLNAKTSKSDEKTKKSDGK